MTIQFQAIEFETADGAIQWTEADGRGVPVTIGGKNQAIDRRDADRLHAAGVEFAYLCDHEMPDGHHRIVICRSIERRESRRAMPDCAAGRLRQSPSIGVR